MINNLRSPEIIKLANQRGIVRVKELAEFFSVSLQTIRKDLNKLCTDGQLERVHGGAIIPSQIENIKYEHRKSINLVPLRDTSSYSKSFSKALSVVTSANVADS